MLSLKFVNVLALETGNLWPPSSLPRPPLPPKTILFWTGEAEKNILFSNTPDDYSL